MANLSDIGFQFETTSEEKSFFIELPPGTVDVQLEVRAHAGVTVNAVTVDGETIFLAAGDRVFINERVNNCASVEMVTEGGFCYRCHVSEVHVTEVLDPRPATVVERLTEADQVAILVKQEISRRIDQLRTELANRAPELEVEDLLDDMKHGDYEFDEDEDQEEFTSTSYEDMAEEVERFDQTAPVEKDKPVSSDVSATSGVEGAGNEAPSTTSG